MDQILSPDLPAYVCYLVVWVVGAVVAFANVNRLLTGHRGYWAFANSWLLFLIYAILPVLLFWFLDYTSALHDTSLFAALVVAAGYQQIFAGGIQGIQMPGQTPRLWKPFETWVTSVAARIAKRSKRLEDQFDEFIRSHISNDSSLLQALLALVYEKNINRSQLDQKLATLAAEMAPSTLTPDEFQQIQAHKRVELLIRELTVAAPDNYGDLLLQRHLISWWMHELWVEDRLSRMTAFCYGSIALAVPILITGILFFSEPVKCWFHQWRFMKVNATEVDHFRSREYIGQQLRPLAQTILPDYSPSKPSVGKLSAEQVLGPLLTKLRFKAIPPRLADDVLRLVVDFHCPAINAVTIPQLVEALRTENADVRLRIHLTLKTLKDADYSSTKTDEATAKRLDDWVPTKDESPGVIDQRVSAWQAWWAAARASSSSACGMKRSTDGTARIRGP